MKISVVICSLMLMAMLFAPLAFAQDLEKGLVAYWKFNDGSGAIASDSSGNGYDGDLVGSPEWVDGYFGGALEFGGSGDEVNVPYDAALNPGTFTICLWANVEPGSAGAHRAAISARDDFPQRGYIIYAEPGDTWQYWIGVGADGVTWNSVQGPAVAAGEWAHLTIIYSNGEQHFYVDGAPAGDAVAELNVNTVNELLIGAGANELDPNLFHFVGKIDDVRIYDRVLTDDEIGQAMLGEASAVSASDKLATTWGMIKN